MAVIDKTPPINATGKYLVDPNPEYPFHELVPANIDFRCEAINGFEALNAKGIDVEATYYTPFNISNSRYNEDKAAGINIITLMSPDRSPVYIPSSFIMSYPNEISIPYGRIVIAIDLGPLPAEYPLDDLKAQLIDVAVTSVGNIGITAKTVVVPVSTFVGSNLAKNLASERYDNTKDTINMYASKLLSDEQIAKSQNKIAGLETVLKQKLGIG